MRRFNLLLVDASLSLLRGWRSSLLAIAALASAVFVVGAFLILSRAAGQALARWSGAAEMSVFLTDTASPEAQAAIEKQLRAHPLVTNVQRVDAREARARFSRAYPDLAPLLDEAGENALPASIDAQLRRGADAAPLLDLARQLRSMPGVADVRLDQELLVRLGGFARGARALGGGLSLAMLLAAVLAIVSVVRLSYVARQHEVEILYLLGAPLAAIRGPFIVEGALQGGVGAVLAMLLLAAAHAILVRVYGNALSEVPLSFLPAGLVTIFVLGGLVFGALAGLMAVMTQHRVVME